MQQPTVTNPVKLIETYLAAALVFMLPLAVLPIFPNIIDTPKLAVTVFLLVALLFIKGLKLIQKGKIEITTGSYDLPLIILSVLYIVSTITRTPNKMEAFFLPGTTSFILSGVILYFVINQFNENQKKVVINALITSGAIFSLISIASIAGIFNSDGVPPIIRQATFNTLGGSLLGIMLIGVTLPFAIHNIIKGKNSLTKILSSVATILLLFGLLINTINSLPGRPSTPRLVDFGTSWTVAVDSFKVEPLLGVGPGNYLTAFNQFRPASYNLSDNWQLRFSTARSYFLTMFTEGGLLVVGAILLIGIKLVRDTIAYMRSVKAENWTDFKPSIIAIWILVLLMVLFPATLPILVLLFLLLALNSTHQKMFFNLTSQSEKEDSFATRFPAILVALPIILFSIATVYYGIRYLTAENTYYRALVALSQDNGAESYDLLRQAIQTNPLVDRYHGTYTQVNLALANAIASKKDVNEEDRGTIAQLIQQAIREGKATVALNPTRAGNWELLASTYRAIIPLAKGADQFSVETYNQAIALDPLNTNYRISLGGILHAAKQYDSAIDVFKLAVLTKPDFANARYNLAVSYKEAGKNEQAINELTTTLSLLERDSEDYKLVQKLLEELQENVRNSKAENGDELTTPGDDIDEPALEPQLELPEGAEPPTTDENVEEGESTDIEASASPTPLP